MIPIPAYVTALQDPALRGNACAVYIWLYEQLDTLTYRPVKQLAIATALHLKENSVKFAIDRLVALGYLDRDPGRRKPCAYRLVHSCPDRRVA